MHTLRRNNDIATTMLATIARSSAIIGNELTVKSTASWTNRMVKSSAKIFFAADIHGSEKAFRKFLNAGRIYEADVVMLCTDLLLR
jgi:hypothetical protein